MQLLAEDGQRSAALAQYETCRVTLANELAVEPSAATEELVAAIRAGSPIELRQSDDRPKPDPIPSSPAASPRLPAPTTSFVGRQEELGAISKLLTEEADCRLLTLVGSGGIGKTRLALKIAADLDSTFPDGVYFVEFRSVRESASMVAAIADALGITQGGDMDLKAKLFAFLRNKRLLLVADNLEHLIDGADLFAQMLAAGSEIRILTTSRERLGLLEEWTFYVSGMDYPGSVNEAVKTLGAYSAVELFAQRARQTKAAFLPDDAELEHIARITQLVDGMPLGIELAATWSSRAFMCRHCGTDRAGLRIPLHLAAERA